MLREDPLLACPQRIAPHVAIHRAQQTYASRNTSTSLTWDNKGTQKTPCDMQKGLLLDQDAYLREQDEKQKQAN